MNGEDQLAKKITKNCEIGGCFSLVLSYLIIFLYLFVLGGTKSISSSAGEI